MARVSQYTALVTVTIPIGLAFDTDKPSREDAMDSALLNFRLHPAINRGSELQLLYDFAKVEFDPPIKCDGCGDTGIRLNQHGKIERCDTCCKYESDEQAYKAANPEE